MFCRQYGNTRSPLKLYRIPCIAVNLDLISQIRQLRFHLLVQTQMSGHLLRYRYSIALNFLLNFKVRLYLSVWLHLLGQLSS